MPESVLAYLSSIGGGSKVNIFSENSFFKDPKTILNDLVANFDENKITGRSVKLNQDLLDNINKRFIKLKLKTNQNQELVNQLKNLVKKKNFTNMNSIYLSDAYLLNVINWTQDRINKLNDLVDLKEFSFLWTDMSNFNQNASINKNLILNLIDKVHAYLIDSKIDLRNNTKLKQDLNQLFEQVKIINKTEDKKINYWQLTRLVLIGSLQGPSIVEIFNILGRENVVFRLNVAKEFCLKN